MVSFHFGQGKASWNGGLAFLPIHWKKLAGSNEMGIFVPAKNYGKHADVFWEKLIHCNNLMVTEDETVVRNITQSVGAMLALSLDSSRLELTWKYGGTNIYHFLSWHHILRRSKPGAGEMVWWLWMFAALPGDLSSVLRAHVRQLTAIYAPSFRAANALSSAGTFTQIHILTWRHTRLCN